MKKFVAEFIGTMALVIFGCGSAVGANTLLTNTLGLTFEFSTLLVAFAFGLVFIAMSYSIGKVSGCHLNPAVSFSMLLSGKMTFVDFVSYICAQFAGGITGAGVLVYLLGKKGGLGQNGFAANSSLGIDMWQALVIEIILTFVFVLVVLGVTSKTENASVSGIVIGLTLTLVHIMGIPFTGTSVNPARSFGPALLMGGEALSQAWVFIVAPLIGAALAALVYKLVICKKEEVIAEEIETEDFIDSIGINAEEISDTVEAV